MDMVTIQKANDQYVIRWYGLKKPIVVSDISTALAIVGRILDSELYRAYLKGDDDGNLQKG